MAKSKSPDDLLVEAIKRIDQATSDISKDVSELNATSARQQATLEEHMRRTEANEKHLELIEARVGPLESHVSMWAGAGKVLTVVLAILSALASIAGAIYKIFF